VPQLGAVEYAFVIIAGAVALALVLVARARRRDPADRSIAPGLLRYASSFYVYSSELVVGTRSIFGSCDTISA
jgi:hypothetical protein